MKLEFVTPNGILFSGEVRSVVLPAFDGYMGVLPGHIPYVALLKRGILTLTSDYGIESFQIETGFAKIENDHVVVLAESIGKVPVTPELPIVYNPT